MAKTQIKKSNIVSFERSADFYLKNGMKKMRAGEYPEAINYLYRSLEREKSFDARIAVAQVLSHTGRFFASNKFIHENFEMQERTAGVHFAMACNYAMLLEKMQVGLSLGRFHTGAYDNVNVSEDTYEALLNLDDSIDLKTFQFVEPQDRSDYIDIALTSGRNMIILGQYKRAAKQLEHALSILPDGMEFIPDLLFAHILSGNHNRAAEILGVYDLDKIHTDSTFLCVLILLKHFVSSKNDAENEASIAMLASIQTENLDLVNYIATTLLFLEEHERVEPFAKKLIKTLPFGTKENHLLGVCSFHLGDYKRAKSCYDTILRFEPHDVVAQNFKMRCSDALMVSENDALSEKEKRLQISYLFAEYTLDYQARYDITQSIKEFLNMPIEKAKDKWEEESEFFYELLYCLEHFMKLRQQTDCIERIAEIGTEKSTKFFEECLMLGDLPFNVKTLCYNLLYKEKSQSYMRAAFGNLIVEGVPSPIQYLYFPESYSDAVRLCMEKLTLRKKGLCCIAAGELFDYYSGVISLPEYKDTMSKGIAAAVAHTAMLRCDLDVDFGYVLNMFRISETKFEEAYDILNDFEFLSDLHNDDDDNE